MYRNCAKVAQLRSLILELQPLNFDNHKDMQRIRSLFKQVTLHGLHSMYRCSFYRFRIEFITWIVMLLTLGLVLFILVVSTFYDYIASIIYCVDGTIIQQFFTV